MNIDQAYGRIEAISGFEDPTVGEGRVFEMEEE
jgi:hypothetical protein